MSLVILILHHQNYLIDTFLPSILDLSSDRSSIGASLVLKIIGLTKNLFLSLGFSLPILLLAKAVEPIPSFSRSANLQVRERHIFVSMLSPH